MAKLRRISRLLVRVDPREGGVVDLRSGIVRHHCHGLPCVSGLRSAGARLRTSDSSNSSAIGASKRTSARSGGGAQVG